MTAPLHVHYDLSVNKGTIIDVPNAGVLQAAGTTVPSDAASGYLPGCIFQKTSGSAGTELYVNQGSANSCDFNPVTGSASMLITDAGNFTAQTTVEGALQELYQNAVSTKGQINVPVGSAILAAGTPMAAFADNAGASAPGVTLANSKAVGVRWNNQGTQTAIWYSVPMPQDLDATAAIVLNFLVSKTGATSGDATTLTVTAFFQSVGALHDADSDCGGATGAVTGNATAKTVAKLTRTIAIADVVAAPSALSFSIKPTDGTLGTDDFIVHAIWIEYKKAIQTS